MDETTELAIVEQFANQLSLNRVKTEGIYFDKDYRRDELDGKMQLQTVKAVVITQGKTSKVAFGKGQKYLTYEEAVEATKQHWAEYFRARRQRAKSETATTGARRRQKAYRERRKKGAEAFSKQQ